MDTGQEEPSSVHAGLSERLLTHTVILSLISIAGVVLLCFFGLYGPARVSTNVAIIFNAKNESSLQEHKFTVGEEDTLAEVLADAHTVPQPEEARVPENDWLQGSEPVKGADAPRVALLFLSRAELPNEPIWRAFFEAAGRLKFRYDPPSRPYESFIYGNGHDFFQEVNKSSRRRLHQAESIQNIMACDNEPSYLTNEVKRLLSISEEYPRVIANQQLFTVYTHPAPDFFFPNTSIFHGTEIQDRVDTSNAWATFALVAAEVELLRAGLKEERNQKFVLLSESCVPIHRPELIYLQALADLVSRINSCNPWDKKHMLGRWSNKMKTKYLTAERWRKSSQWFQLKRSHAELIANEEHVKKKFQSLCRGGRFCVPDEHYIATALAVYYLGNETDCGGRGTATWWPQSGRAHPVTFSVKNINPILFKKQNPTLSTDSMNADAAQASTEGVFIDSRVPEERCLFYNNPERVFTPPTDTDDWVTSTGFKSMSTGCPLFARKFPKNAVPATLKTALQCAGAALGYWC